MKLFISHSSKDKEFVEKLANGLKKANVDVWLDLWEIKPGDSIIDKINDGLAGSDFLGIVLSKNSVASEWVKKEVNASFFKEVNQKSVSVIPIYIEDCIVPPLLSDKVYADFRGTFDDGLRQLIDSLAHHKNSGDGLKIEAVQILEASKPNVFCLEAIISNSRHRTAWFSKTRLSSSIESAGSGLAFYLNKLVFHVHLNGSVPEGKSAQEPPSISGLVSEGEKFEFSERFEGSFIFSEVSGSKSWEVNLEIPTRFYLPSYDKVAVRFLFESPQKKLIKHEKQGQHVSSVSYGLASKQFTMSLTLDDGSEIVFQNDDEKFLEFIANTGEVLES